MAVGNVYRAALRSTDSNNANEIVNVFHLMQMVPTVLDTPPQDLGDAFLTQLLAEYRACMSSSYYVRDVNIRNISDDSEVEIISMGNAQGLLSTGDNVPRQMCPIITWRTGRPGRRYRGRTFMPVVTEPTQADGALTGAFMGTLAAFADEMLALPNDTTLHAGWQLGIWSPTYSIFTEVSSYTVQPIMGVQRRRRFGHGS